MGVAEHGGVLSSIRRMEVAAAGKDFVFSCVGNDDD